MAARRCSTRPRKQATLALYYSRLVDQSLFEARRQAVLEERNRIARDIHDTLAQGFGAILMQLAVGAARAAPAASRQRPSSASTTAVDLARTHLVEARRSVAALRPQSTDREDVAAALHADGGPGAAGRTTCPSIWSIDELPPFDAGVEREIIGIAQEALTNAVRHANARRIVGAGRRGSRRRLPPVGGRRRPRDRAATAASAASA